jgi:uracil-DNA glycosylase family 4
VLKCRPPNNRTPNSTEVSHCRGYFERQLEVLRPEFICCLGSVAAQALLETTIPVGRLRGRLHDYQGAKVVVTYHPSYLLRTLEAKKDAWQDLQLLMREMGLPVPKH